MPAEERHNPSDAGSLNVLRDSTRTGEMKDKKEYKKIRIHLESAVAVKTIMAELEARMR